MSSSSVARTRRSQQPHVAATDASLANGVRSIEDWRLRVSLDVGRHTGAMYLSPPDADDGSVFAVIDAITGHACVYTNPRATTHIAELGRECAAVTNNLEPLKIKRWRDGRFYDYVELCVPLRGQQDAVRFLQCVAVACVEGAGAVPADYEEAARYVVPHLLNSADVRRMHESEALGVTDEPLRVDQSFDVPPKFLHVLMRYPPWAQLPGDKRIFQIGKPRRADAFLKVVPDHELGMITYDDLRLLMFASSFLAARQSNGLPVSNTITYAVPQYLRFTEALNARTRYTSGSLLCDHQETQGRLLGARFETNLFAAGVRQIGQFNLLQEAHAESGGRGKTTAGRIVLCDWLFRALRAGDGYLSVPHEYMRARALKQSLLLLAIRYCGSPTNPNPMNKGEWRVPTEKLMDLTRSGGASGDFRRRVSQCRLPDHTVRLVPGEVVLRVANQPRSATHK